LIKTLSPLLFSAPDVHLRTLEKMWVDGIMHGPVWQDTVKKLNDEWQEFILYVSRLLSWCIVAGDKGLIQSTCVCVGYSVAQRHRSLSSYSEYRHSQSRLPKSSSSWLLSVHCGQCRQYRSRLAFTASEQVKDAWDHGRSGEWGFKMLAGA
jgi:hypothetical protein